MALAADPVLPSHLQAFGSPATQGKMLWNVAVLEPPTPSTYDRQGSAHLLHANFKPCHRVLPHPGLDIVVAHERCLVHIRGPVAREALGQHTTG